MALLITWSTSNVLPDESGDLVATATEHVLEFDATTKEVHEWGGVSTEHPLEGGAKFSDHKAPADSLITLEVKVTNQPIGNPPPSGYGSGSTVTSFTEKSEIAGLSVLQFSREFDRIADVMFTLYRLATEPTLVTITTAKRTYVDVSIERVTVPRDSPSDIYTFTIDAKEIRTVETADVGAPESREARGQTGANNGSQEGQDADSRPERSQSILRAFEEGGVDGVLGMFQ